MRFRSLQDRVLIRPIVQEGKTASGIHIPDSAVEKPTEGEIVAAGPDAGTKDGRIPPLDVQVGDGVLYGKWSGTEIRLDGEDLIIMKEQGILGILARDAGSARKAA